MSRVYADTLLAPKGTELYTAIQQRLSSKTNQNGDPFTLTLKNGFFHKNPENIAGAIIEGHIEQDVPASPLHKASMSIVFDDMKLADGTVVPISAKLRSLSTFEPHTHHIRDAGLIVGGAIIGHVMGSHHGMKHGGLAGATTGFALASALKSDIVVKKNTQLDLRLTADLLQSSPGDVAPSSSSQ